jgi:hypothetical protein
LVSDRLNLNDSALAHRTAFLQVDFSNPDTRTA